MPPRCIGGETSPAQEAVRLHTNATEGAMTTDSDARARVIVVNYNGGDYVEHAVSSALRQTVPVEVVAVDNASEDGSVDTLEGISGIKVIRCSSNLGFGAAINIGARGTAAPFLAFLNPDAVGDANWIETLTLWMDQEHLDIACSLVRDNGGFHFTRGLWVWWARWRDQCHGSIVRENRLDKRLFHGD